MGEEKVFEKQIFPRQGAAPCRGTAYRRTAAAAGMQTGKSLRRPETTYFSVSEI